jgi:hypothetical protein
MQQPPAHFESVGRALDPSRRESDLIRRHSETVSHRRGAGDIRDVVRAEKPYGQAHALAVSEGESE